MITHNPKVAGSNPAPATTETPCLQDSYQVGQRFLQGATHRPPCGHPRPPCGHPSATQRPPPATDRPPPATDRPPPATDRPPCGHQRPPIGHPTATRGHQRPPCGHPSATSGHPDRPPPATAPSSCRMDASSSSRRRRQRGCPRSKRRPHHDRVDSGPILPEELDGVLLAATLRPPGGHPAATSALSCRQAWTDRSRSWRAR